jgi:RNA polymerase sigma factor (sigma-70 family)
MTNDLDLLGQFIRDHSQDAFTALVNRHVNLVYSAALRQVRSPQLAEEVTQSVFTDLARNAGKLKADTVLTAWLYQIARRTAIDVVRRESRRQLREQIAVEMTNMNATASNWLGIEPLLDDAMAVLDETDRSAVLLRYFENKSLREVGETLGASEDAAQKRVSRAVDRLREFFAKRGGAIGASGLVLAISTNAVQAAPAGLGVTISTAALLAGTTLATTTTATAIKAIAMTTLQKTLITATIVAAAGTGIYEVHQASNLRSQNELLRQQQATLADQIQQFQSERDAATNRLASLADEVAKTRSDNVELLKLRSEVRRLRLQTNALGKLQVENRKLHSSLTAGPEAPEVKPPPETAPQDTFPRESWTAAGYADPRSAFQSAVLAITKGDVQAYAVSLSPEMLQAKNKEVGDVLQLTGKSEADLAAETAQQYKVVTGYRILDQQFVADDQVVLHVYLDGVGVEKLIRMKKIGNEWKLDAAP